MIKRENVGFLLKNIKESREVVRVYCRVLEILET